MKNQILSLLFLLREDYYFYGGTNKINPYAKISSRFLGFLFPRISNEVDEFLDGMANPSVPFDRDYPIELQRTYYGE